MIEAMMVITALVTVIVLILLVLSKTAWEKVLMTDILSAAGTVLIVFYGLLTENEMIADVAIAFVLLGFMSVQFYAVYLRKRGDL